LPLDLKRQKLGCQALPQPGPVANFVGILRDTIEVAANATSALFYVFRVRALRARPAATRAL